ncbi:metallophosphoesterase [Acidaminobacter hydrogenoformans]|uniref:Calcineurin-like phosphoesterase n=1 Tax=Acidaminobacter hydrogenoformans DSM 2784 TaxID=1120920 RepID=A0A1G5S3Z4_9FIRM|nr:metallophosphoesterase [Acidaminobacter hydrogenoformans]SCZ81043.1 Calcineurin-like phosphoesterase [Acidaminobacter hydrogenoformans DSM 2784]
MKTIKKLLWQMMGHVSIDQAALHAKGPTVLHISDTPRSFYPELKRLLDILKPNVIIHTGDLADDLKLENRPSLLDSYEKAVIKLMRIVNQSAAETVVFTLGNHDNFKVVSKHAGRAEVYQDAVIKSFHGNEILCAHYHDAAFDAAASKMPDFALYGHDLSLKSLQSYKAKNLNGIEAMHLIDLSTGAVFVIKYPIGTDNERLNRKRLRL